MLSYGVVDALVRYLETGNKLKVEMGTILVESRQLGYKMTSYICKSLKKMIYWCKTMEWLQNFTFTGRIVR